MPSRKPVIFGMPAVALCMVLLSANTSWALDITDSWFYTYGNTLEPVAEAFFSIAHIFKNNDYENVVRSILLFGALTGGLVAITRGLIAPGRFNQSGWMVPTVSGLAIYMALFATTGTLHIQDESTGEIQDVGDIPQAVILLAAGVNNIEKIVIDLIEAARAPSAGKTYSTSAGGFPWTVLVASMTPETQDANFDATMGAYIESCVTYELLRPGTALSLDGMVHNSNDYVAQLAHGANPAVFTYIWNAANPNGTADTCDNAWDNELKPILTGAALQTQLLDFACEQAGIDIGSVGGRAFCKTALEAMLFEITGTAITAEGFTQQVYLSQKIYEEMLTAGLGSAIGTVVNQKAATSGFGALVAANEYMPTMRAGLTALSVGLIPILALFIPTPVGGRAMSTMAGFFIWLAAWGCIDAMVHGFAVSQAYVAFSEIGGTGSYGMAELLNMPTAAVKVLGTFGALRMASMTFAGLVSMLLVKFGGHALVSGIRGVQAAVQAGAERGGMMATPQGMGQAIQGMTDGTVPLQMAANAPFATRLAAGVASAEHGLGHSLALAGASGGARSAGEAMGTLAGEGALGRWAAHRANGGRESVRDTAGTQETMAINSAEGQQQALNLVGTQAARNAAYGNTLKGFLGGEAVAAALLTAGQGNAGGGYSRAKAGAAERALSTIMGDEGYAQAVETRASQIQGQQPGLSRQAALTQARGEFANLNTAQLAGQIEGAALQAAAKGDLSPGAVGDALQMASMIRSAGSIEGAAQLLEAANATAGKLGHSGPTAWLDALGDRAFMNELQKGFGDLQAAGSAEDAIKAVMLGAGMKQGEAQQAYQSLRAAAGLVGGEQPSDAAAAGFWGGSAAGKMVAGTIEDANGNPVKMAMRRADDGSMTARLEGLDGGGGVWAMDLSLGSDGKVTGGRFVGENNGAKSTGRVLPGQEGMGAGLQVSLGSVQSPLSLAMGENERKAVTTSAADGAIQRMEGGEASRINWGSGVQGSRAKAAAKEWSGRLGKQFQAALEGAQLSKEGRETASRLGAGISGSLSASTIAMALAGPVLGRMGKVGEGALRKLNGLLKGAGISVHGNSGKGGKAGVDMKGGIGVVWADGTQSTLSSKDLESMQEAWESARRASVTDRMTSSADTSSMAEIFRRAGDSKTAEFLQNWSQVVGSMKGSNYNPGAPFVAWAAENVPEAIPADKQGDTAWINSAAGQSIIAGNLVALAKERPDYVQSKAMEFLGQFGGGGQTGTEVDEKLESRAEEGAATSTRAEGAGKQAGVDVESQQEKVTGQLRGIEDAVDEGHADTRVGVARNMDAENFLSRRGDAVGAGDHSNVSLTSIGGRQVNQQGVATANDGLQYIDDKVTAAGNAVGNLMGGTPESAEEAERIAARTGEFANMPSGLGDSGTETQPAPAAAAPERAAEPAAEPTMGYGHSSATRAPAPDAGPGAHGTGVGHEAPAGEGNSDSGPANGRPGAGGANSGANRGNGGSQQGVPTSADGPSTGQIPADAQDRGGSNGAPASDSAGNPGSAGGSADHAPATTGSSTDAGARGHDAAANGGGESSGDTAPTSGRPKARGTDSGANGGNGGSEQGATTSVVGQSTGQSPANTQDSGGPNGAPASDSAGNPGSGAGPTDHALATTGGGTDAGPRGHDAAAIAGGESSGGAGPQGPTTERGTEGVSTGSGDTNGDLRTAGAVGTPQEDTGTPGAGEGATGFSPITASLAIGQAAAAAEHNATGEGGKSPRISGRGGAATQSTDEGSQSTVANAGPGQGSHVAPPPAPELTAEQREWAQTQIGMMPQDVQESYKALDGDSQLRFEDVLVQSGRGMESNARQALTALGEPHRTES